MRLGLGLLRSLGLACRKFSAKSKSDSARGAEAALAGNGVAVQVMGIYIIDRPQLNSDVTKEPIIKATAAGERHRGIGDGKSGLWKIHPVSPNQTVYKARDPAGAIPYSKAGSKHVGKIAAVHGTTAAIAQAVVAEVCLGGKMMKQADRGGEFPAL